MEQDRDGVKVRGIGRDW